MLYMMNYAMNPTFEVHSRGFGMCRYTLKKLSNNLALRKDVGLEDEHFAGFYVYLCDCNVLSILFTAFLARFHI